MTDDSVKPSSGPSGDETLEELADDWVHEMTQQPNRLRLVIDLEKTGEHDWESKLAYTCNGLTMGVGFHAIVTNVIDQMEKNGLTSGDTAPWKELQAYLAEKLGSSSFPLNVKSKPFIPREPRKEPLGRFENIISSTEPSEPSE